jgi:hypothetical protein
MRIIDFKNLTVKTEINYKVINFTFELNNILDIPFIQFTKELSKDVKDKIAAANLSQYKDDSVVFQFKTDLKSHDLDAMIPALITAFVLGLNIDKTEFKHGEKRLSVPQTLGIDKGYMMDANALDLINYNLPIERFNLLFFNKNDKSLTSILS